MGDTTPVREEIPFHTMVGDVCTTAILVGIAIYEIWLCDKLIMV
jgi:hypothetical protein